MDEFSHEELQQVVKRYDQQFNKIKGVLAEKQEERDGLEDALSMA
jgi:uncharacterized protein YukE